MITLYIYNKRDGRLVSIDTGTVEDVLRDLKDGHDFTLEKPPGPGAYWKWVGSEWVKDNSPEQKQVMQAEVWELIKQQRQSVIESGVFLPSVDKVLQTDQNSMGQYSNIATMIALDNYTPVEWKTLDNTWVTLTVEVFKELQQTIRQRTDRAFAVAEEHKAKMLETDNPEEYDYSTGWEVSVS